MKTITQEIFSFDELSEEAKQVALEQFSDINTDHNWYEFIYDDFKEQLKENTLFVAEKIYFSGFYSQGDGAMFEGSFLVNDDSDIKLLNQYFKPRIVKLIKKGLITLTINFNHYGHYCHEKSYQNDFDLFISYDKKFTENISKEIHEAEDKITEDYEILCKDLYRDLEEEYDFQSEAEQIAETIRINEYEFFKNGKQYVSN